eukprot:1152209-Pelagomonas_calceolata.AAC.3
MRTYSAYFLGVPSSFGDQELLLANSDSWITHCLLYDPNSPFSLLLGEPGDSFVRTPFWQAFACFPAPQPVLPPAQIEFAELLRGFQTKVLHTQYSEWQRGINSDLLGRPDFQPAGKENVPCHDTT